MAAHPFLIDLPMPICTPRLLLRPKQQGDGELTAAAVMETWEDLHEWMRWAENPADFTAERMEIRTRQMMANFLLREVLEFIGIETASGQPVVWCGLHDIDWSAGTCDTGYWVRKAAQNRGFATEAANALVRYGFRQLRMHRIGLTHSAGNEPSRRVAEKLGFIREGIQRDANLLPGGRFADRYCYARFNPVGMPELNVTWGIP